MTVAERRESIAQTITEFLLPDVSVDAYRSSSPAPFTGWLQIEQTDLQDATYGEVRLTVECMILVATDRADFERVQDTLTVPLIAAVTAAGGRGTVVTPYTESVDHTTFYALSARFVTEAQT